MRFRPVFATYLLTIIGIAGFVPAQELPPAEPKPKPRPEQPAEPTPTPPPPETPTPPPVPPGSLLIKVDAPCKIVVDGEDVATLAAGQVRKVLLDLGEHLVEAISTEEEGVLWEKVISIEDNTQQFARVKLAHPVAAAKGKLRLGLPFTHEATGLMWTPTDSGHNQSYSMAYSYCQRLVFGGFDDWRLPTIDELRSIYFPASERPFKTVYGIYICDKVGENYRSRYFWSSEGELPYNCFVFEFSDGALRKASTSSKHRVLCVRTGSNPDG